MKIFERTCLIIAAVAFPLISILGAGVLVSRTPDFYSYEFTKLRSIQDAGVRVTEEDMAALFVDFINGSKDSFQMKAEYNDEETELFSAKEQIHMADVKTLIDQLSIALGISAVLLAVSVIVLIRRKEKMLLRRAYLVGVGVFAAVLAVLAVAMLTDFTAGFYTFHRIFFTNDLWLLDPEQDVLLMIMPEKFFADGAVAVLVISILALTALGLGTWKLTKERNMFASDGKGLL